MTDAIQNILIFLSAIGSIACLIWVIKHRSLESTVALISALITCIALIYTSDSVQISQPITNIYYVNRDTVLQSTKIFNHYPIDTAYIRDTAYVIDTLERVDTIFTNIDINKIFSDRVLLILPEEKHIAINANAFISSYYPNLRDIYYSFSPNKIDSIKTFDCNHIGVNELKLYVFIKNVNIKEMSADLDLRDPDDLCMKR